MHVSAIYRGHAPKTYLHALFENSRLPQLRCRLDSAFARYAIEATLQPVDIESNKELLISVRNDHALMHGASCIVKISDRLRLRRISVLWASYRTERAYRCIISHMGKSCSHRVVVRTLPRQSDFVVV